MTSPTCSSSSATCCRSRSPRSGSATRTRSTTSPSTSAPASTPPGAAARDGDLHQHGLARRPIPHRAAAVPKSGPLLAAFTVESSRRPGSPDYHSGRDRVPALHRTRPVSITGQTLAFGFRAASITGEAEAAALAAVADLDLSQARRHAAILTGCSCPGRLPSCRCSPGPRCAACSLSSRNGPGRHKPAQGGRPCSTALRPAGPAVSGGCLPAGLPDHRPRLPSGPG